VAELALVEKGIKVALFSVSRKSVVSWTVIAVVCGLSHIGHAKEHVSGYTKSNGTHVAPYYRSSPNGSFSDNWSTKGNFNPHTGKEGTRVTPPSSLGRSYGGAPFYGSYSAGMYEGAAAGDSANSVWVDGLREGGRAVITQSSDDSASGIAHEVASMTYHGVGFTTTQQQFVQAFPGAIPVSQTDRIGMVTYLIDDVDSKRDAVCFQFLDNQLVHIVFSYGEGRIRQYGGTNVLLDRAKQKFGPPARETDGTALWLFPAVDRLVMSETDNNGWYLILTSLSGQKVVNSKRAQVDVGF
jgi:hypothetical protein